MPSTNVARPADALAVAERYARRERPLSVVVALALGSIFLATYLATSLVPGLLVAVLLLVLARAPVLRSRGTVRLRTDEDHGAVAEAFAGPTPPVLAFQWGVADEIATEDGVATYEFSYAFGLQSVEMTVEPRRADSPEGAHRVVLDVETNGRPWATYTATIRSDGDGTSIDVEYESNRRFGLRRLSQWYVAARYYDHALLAQGYEVVEHDRDFGV